MRFNPNGSIPELMGRVVLLLIGFILSIVLLMVGLKYLFMGLDQFSFFQNFYLLTMVMLPAVFFITVFVIFFLRTTQHVSTPVRYLSYAVFSVSVLGWLYFLISDVALFFGKGYTEISKYQSFSLLFLSSSIGTIFFIGVIQALTTGKETDWMDKYK
jgi:hypothetical protein